MTKPIYVTTTIPYVNAPPHVGFALELVQADALARYNRLTGREVRLQTGTDENAFKNVLSAECRGIGVQQLVDENSARFRELTRALDVSADRFQRTTDPTHRRAVGAFFARLRRDDLFTDEYRGLYCPGCEDFYLESESVGRCCPEHGTLLVDVAERNHFFRLSAYQSRLHELISSRRIHVVPAAREAEVLGFIERGLADISISRDATRSRGWGIPYPGDPRQIVYVWIDALINYLSGLGFPEDGPTRCWDIAEKCHVIGKNVWKFHAVYWPALLLSAGLELPDRIVVHGFLTNEGRKISKSAGDAVDPVEYIDDFGADPVRYFLLRHARPFEDSDFSVDRLTAAYNADLSNGLGNLTSRLTALCESAEVSRVTVPAGPPPDGFHEEVGAFRFDLALALLWGEVADLNRELGAARPWDDIKSGRLTEARAALEPLVGRLSTLAHWLSPFLPRTSRVIRDVLAGPSISRSEPLFPRRRVTRGGDPG
jgi:methionyl-tRNA synthetase